MILYFYPSLFLTLKDNAANKIARIKKTLHAFRLFIYNFSTRKNKNPPGKIEKYFTRNKKQIFL